MMFVHCLINNTLTPVFHTGMYWNSADLLFMKGINLIENEVDMGSKQFRIPENNCIVSSWPDCWFIFRVLIVFILSPMGHNS